LGVGWFCFVGMMIPVIGLIQVGIQSMADRYMYLPMIGLLLMLVWTAAELLGSRKAVSSEPSHSPASLASLFSPLPSTLFLVLVAACGAVTWVQVQYWRNSEVLFRRA